MSILRMEIIYKMSMQPNKAVDELFELCIFSFNEQGKILSANERAIELFQLKIGEFLCGCGNVFFDTVFATAIECTEAHILIKGIKTNFNEQTVTYQVRIKKTGMVFHVCLIEEDRVEHCFSSIAAEEKMASVGRLSEGIAHNLKSPLMTLRNISDYMSVVVMKWKKLLDKTHKGCPFDKGRNDVGDLLKQMQEDIGSSVDVMTNIISSLRIYNKTDRLDDVQIVNIVDMLKTVAKMAEYNAKMTTTISLKAFDDEIFVSCVPSDMQVVFVNLLENSIEQIIENKVEEGKIYIVVEKKKNVVEIIVKDNGGGINKRLLEKGELFEPFATYKIGGTGLGLHFCFKILKQHSGDIFAKNYKEKGVVGAQFKVVLPLVDYAYSS